LPYANISTLTFEDEGTGVSELSDIAVSITYRVADEQVLIESAQPLSSVRLYSLQGTLLQSLAPQSLSCTLSLSAYPAGIYIVQASSGQIINTQKIIKQ
jgi:hypothetical protein